MEHLSNRFLCASGISITGRTRAVNEDSCGFCETLNGSLFTVCDGMGGHIGGAVASKIAVESIISYLSKEKYADITQAIRDALVCANRNILARTCEEPSLKGMGTTACIVLYNEGRAWIAHVGDSRIYLFRAQDKTLHRITKDHSYVQSLVDAGELDDRDAEHHPRKNIILNALGVKENLSSDIPAEPVVPMEGDMFLICSDGLSGMVDDDRIESIIRKGASVEDCLETLIGEANAPDKGKDNITGLLIRVNSSDAKCSVFPDHNPRWRKASIHTATDEGKKGRGRTRPYIIAAIIAAVIAIVAGTICCLAVKSPAGRKQGIQQQPDPNVINVDLREDRRKER